MRFRQSPFNHTFGGLVLILAAQSARTDDALSLREAFPVGYEYHVSTRVELAGKLTPPAAKDKPAEPLAVKGESAIEYDERILAASGTAATKTARIYRRIDFQRTVADRPQQATLRQAVRRVILLRTPAGEVPFSPDGPLTWNEIDQVRTDVFTPALAGLLSERAVRPGDRWTATALAVQELTDLEKVEEGQVECRFDQLLTLEKRRHARVSFAGSVRGTNEDGPNRQSLDGYLYFDLESNHLSYLYLRGVSQLLDKDGKEMGRIEGRFVLTRRAHTRCAELSDRELRGVAVEPNAANTQLLYENADLGVRMQHPRRWRVAGTRAGQVALDSADGSGLLISVEPLARVPTGAQFLAESRGYLEKQKARVLRTEPVQTLRSVPLLEQFALEIEMGGQRLRMDYFVTRQSNGGATLAARLLPDDQAAHKAEVERIARSIELLPVERKPGTKP
jgi:hypothetical protein